MTSVPATAPTTVRGAQRSLRPPVEAFRRFGWLPQSPDAYDKWMSKMHAKMAPLAAHMPGPGITYGTDKEAPALLVPIQEFKDFIEGNVVVFTDLVRMFDGMTESPTSYQEMLLMFNEIFREAPSFGSLGPPMYMIMARVMNTEGGFSAFTKESLNLQFKKMLQTWERYLLSKDSTSVLNTNPDGWFSTEAIDAMMEKYAPGRTFAEVFICNPDEDAWGFTSYEDFFVRRYREPDVDRPTGDVSDLRIVGAACESAFYALQNDVQRTDELFIKDEAYSLVHLLAGDESVDSFIGGTVIQSFLNTTGYHRWHVPVNGTIKKIVDVPGTYFAQAPSLIGLETGPDELPPYLQSLQFFANTAARQLIFIEAENTQIGLMCFIAIGMTEISSCEATVFEGQHVTRGEELGMFHFGGSSSAMVFRASAGVQFGGEYIEPGAHIPINAPIGVANI
ncbi:hypothetical protein PC9H_008613 [Pleurotus ostreatus]|uniref:L-tryptophan decarboxylase PsiD-like domain-containing protein n=2 Tax=Pleurotus TaxID=5320 RepID=A0A8H6ZSZ6_PLEOS|nr:uncharacterized protein PC9H_008613 [Pleurotus ostreatus]KAF7426246.1 hypothetical protein PC9H_008613 [Pleurotus ostreatus]KAG9221803.1 hypothetical protein CCMSSC00406_0006746 [Pleurotus cornucopiae]KAJ8693716.1 hypothetical protein PTI98_008689 [Pleurotus ostreatus]